MNKTEAHYAAHAIKQHDRMVAMLKLIDDVSCNFPEWWFSQDGESLSMNEELDALLAEEEK